MELRHAAAITALSLTLLGAVSANSRAAEVVVLSTVAAQSVLEEIAPVFEHESKQRLVLRFATTAELKTEIEKGARCDVALLTASAVDDLIKQGLLTQDSRIKVAKAGVGIAVRMETNTPSITTAEELRRALLSTKSILYSAKGTSGPIMRRIFEQLGITDTMRAKTVEVTATTAPQALASGQAEMGFMLTSEILETPGVRLVGQLPSELQVYSPFAAAVATGAKDPRAAQALVDVLKSDAAKAILKARGLEPD